MKIMKYHDDEDGCGEWRCHLIDFFHYYYSVSAGICENNNNNAIVVMTNFMWSV